MKKNYLYNLLLTLANILFPILSFPYASRVLGPVGIGKAQFILSFAQYFALFAALGIPVYGISEIARSKGTFSGLTRTFSELLFLNMLAGVLFAVLYFLVILYFSFFRADFAVYSVAGLLVLLAFSSVDWFYSGIEKYRLIALRSVFIKVVSVIFLYIFVKSAADYFNYLLVLLFSLLGNNLVSLILIRKHTGITTRGISLSRHLKPMIFILGMTLATNMYTLWDTVLLGFLSDAKTVGFYTAAIKLVKISIPFIISMSTILIPSLSESFKKNDKEQVKQLLENSFNYIILLSVPVAAGLVLLAPEFILVFSGKQFYAAVPVMQVLAVLPLIVGMGHFFSLQILVPAGLNREIFFATLAGACCSLVLNLSLVPLWNAFGAGVASVCTELLVASLCYYYVSKYYTIRINWKLLFKAISCTALFVPIVMVTRQYVHSLYLVLTLSVLSCALEYFLLQWFAYNDKMLQSLVNPVFTKANSYLKSLSGTKHSGY